MVVLWKRRRHIRRRSAILVSRESWFRGGVWCCWWGGRGCVRVIAGLWSGGCGVSGLGVVGSGGGRGGFGAVVGNRGGSGNRIDLCLDRSGSCCGCCGLGGGRCRVIAVVIAFVDCLALAVLWRSYSVRYTAVWPADCSPTPDFHPRPG